MEQPPSRGDADAPRQTFLAFQFDVEGNPVIPPRVPALEPAPLDPSRLSPGQRDLWATANRAEAEGWDPSRLFEPFFRRGSELRRETQGIGIGLSIVKHVAEAHGGSVHVESQLGQGSRFAIRLPLTTWPPDPELKPTA